MIWQLLLKNLWRNTMFKTTVDSVLKTLNKAITDLEVVRERQKAIASARRSMADQATVEAQIAEAERSRAERVRDRLIELLD